jgi:hypothetical protein
VVRDLGTRVQDALAAPTAAANDETADLILRWYHALPRLSEVAA